MKNLIAIILISISTFTFGQDTEMLGFINQYRTSHGKGIVKVSSKLTDIAVTCNKANIDKDTLVHTRIANTAATGEIITKGKHLPATPADKVVFTKFIKSFFGLTYVEPTTEAEVVTYTKLYILYMYDQSSGHKAILLGNFTNVGFDTMIKDIKPHAKPNPIVVGGKVYEHKNVLNYYHVTFYSTIDFN
jgi:uncharacterized protein YkwD